MKFQYIVTFIILIAFALSNAISQKVDKPIKEQPATEKIETKTVEGIITAIKYSDAYVGAIKLELTINGGTIDLIYYLKEYHEDSHYLNKKVSATYAVIKTLKEEDMFANDSSVYYDRKKPKDISKALKVEGILDIYDYGCSMPGKYFIKSSDSSVTTFRHFVDWKYQKPHEFKNVTVYYSIENNNMVHELLFLENNDEVQKDTIVFKHHPVYSNSKYETKLSIVEVKNDSRCPTNVQCKWAGNAEVFLKVKQPNKIDTTFTLNTHQKFDTEIEIDGYIYKLIELTPYPKSGIGILQSRYKAKVLIEKR